MESENLKGFISKLNPKFRIPTRKEFIFKILSDLNAETSSAARNLIQTSTCISFTTDTWTSVSNDSYMSIIAHFISDAYPHIIK